MGILAAILSFVFSHKITAPIKKLTHGAKQIAKRNYNHPIEINTSDELRDLAESFNRISTELSLFETRQKQWIMDISHELHSKHYERTIDTHVKNLRKKINTSSEYNYIRTIYGVGYRLL